MLRANSGSRASSLLLLLVVSSAFGSQRPKSALREPLSQQVNNYDDSGHDFATTIDHLMQKYKVPWGMDWEAPVKSDRISVHIPRGTVADVLNAIVAHESNYRWVETNGVVNVIPRQNMNSLMDVPIAHFHVIHADFFGLHKALVSLPEVKEWLRQNHLTEDSPGVLGMLVGKDGMDSTKVSLSLDHVTLREILNRIVKFQGYRLWQIARWGEKNQYLSLGVY